jgi:hypothetical protein
MNWRGPVLIAFLLVSPSAAAGELPCGMPEYLYVESLPGLGDYARWVSEDRASDADGELDEELIHPESRRLITNFLKIPARNGCIPLEEFYQEGVGRRDVDTLEGRFAASELVLHGRVTGKAPGFLAYSPGQLVRLEPIRLLKGDETPLPRYYTFFPVGTVRLGEATLCKTDSRFPRVPEIGDELILMVLDRPDPSEPLLEPDLYGAEGYLTIHDGHVDLPSRFRGKYPEEITPLWRSEVLRIEVGHVENRRRDRHGNELRYNGRAWLVADDGRVRPTKTTDVFFRVDGAVTAREVQP